MSAWRDRLFRALTRPPYRDPEGRKGLLAPFAHPLPHRVRHLQMELPGWPRWPRALRIAYLSDFHAGSHTNDVARFGRIVEEGASYSPDLGLFGGDYVNFIPYGGGRVPPRTVAAILSRLKAPLGQIAVLGNHDRNYGEAEIAEALRAIERMHLPQAELLTRRRRPDPHGLRLDLRRTLRASLRTGGDIIDIHRLGRIEKPAPIVALLDISGSMSEYTRLFLHFLHAITDARKRVSVFLFGTRLTNVTRALRQRDPDEALASCSAAVEDWAGGTRISASLHNFNKLWARRVLSQGAIVLLISDGLEREADSKLAFEMDRLHRSCRRLIWLNPLLRFGGFEAKAQGIKMMLPHVDEFRPVHNLSSIHELISTLSRPLPPHHRSLIRSAA